MPKAIAFSDPLHGWVVGIRSVARSVDGGSTWQTVLSSPQAEGLSVGNTYGLLDVAASDDRHAWVVGSGGHDQPLVLSTSDGGATWQEQHIPGDNGPAIRVALADNSNGWLLTQDIALGRSSIYCTQDGGRKWRLQLTTRDRLSAIAFDDRKQGWAAAQGSFADPSKQEGMVKVTNNGGDNWSDSFMGRFPLHNVVALGSEFACAVGDAGEVTVTRDGGTTWQRLVPRQVDDAVVDVAWANTDDGWIVVGRSQLLYTRDGGRTWYSVTGDDGGGGAYYVDVETLSH
jgi:photosystem II stability/assembly factor-like uncharacterized protein